MSTEKELEEWLDVGTDPDPAPDYAEAVVELDPIAEAEEEKSDFAKAPDEKTVPYPMTHRVREGSEGAMIVEFDLPGVKALDTSVKIVGETIEVKACRPDSTDLESTSFTVPAWDLSNAIAWIEDGVLRIRIPKAPFTDREVFVKSR